MLKETDKAYFAGLIDSDGCITVNRSRRNDNYHFSYTVWVQIAQIDHEALQELVEKFNVNSYKKLTKHGKILHRVLFVGTKAYL